MDFCSEPLEPVIVSDKPCIDGCEPNVLALKNNVPFRCEAFIRAPIEIRVEFVVPIDIARIVIGPEVNERYASGFSITTHYTTVASSTTESRRNSLPGPSSILNPLKEFLSRAPSLSQLGSKPSSESSQFTGQWFTGQQKLVVLRNRQYKHFLNVPLPSEYKGLHVYEGSLKHQDKFSLRNVHAITIRILRIIPTGPPALRFLEVWGQPAVGVELNTKMELIASWNDFQAKRKAIFAKPQPFYNSTTEGKEDTGVLTTATQLKDDADIPDDFLDPLTCEVMTVPLLLPSGNSIDSQSLDRFIAHEALWGRKPSDPFTGVPFKPLFNPVANVHLKMRIDRFLLLNNVEGCGRTVSSVNSETSHCGRSRLLGKRRPTQESSPVVKKAKKPCPLPPSPVIAQCPTTSRQSRSNAGGHRLIKRLNSSFKQTSRPPTVPVRPLSATAQLTIPQITPDQHGEARPLGSQNESLLSPRSSTLSLLKSGSLPKCSCSKDATYELTCPHPICGPCLLKGSLPDGLVECPECFVTTQNKDVFRKHPTSIFKF